MEIINSQTVYQGRVFDVRVLINCVYLMAICTRWTLSSTTRQLP